MRVAQLLIFVFEKENTIKSESMTQGSPLRDLDFAIALNFRMSWVISVAQNLQIDQIRVSRERLFMSWLQSCKACKSFDPHKLIGIFMAYIHLPKRVVLICDLDTSAMIPNLTVKHRVLVIDDEPGMRSLMRRGLGLAGFEVQTAEDGELGLELVKTYLPDLVLLDLMMPGLDGFETLDCLCVLEQRPKVIVLSGRDEPEDRARAAKAHGFLVKPISFDALLEMIRLTLNAEQNLTEAKV
jgi:CheY-like chemotaxis protein